MTAQGLRGWPDSSPEDLAAFTDWLIDAANLPAGKHDIAKLWERWRQTQQGDESQTVTEP
jgi:hypothetical protein